MSFLVRPTVGRIVHVGMQNSQSLEIEACAAIVVKITKDSISFTVFLPDASGVADPKSASIYLRLTGDEMNPTKVLMHKRWTWPPRAEESNTDTPLMSSSVLVCPGRGSECGEIAIQSGSGMGLCLRHAVRL